MAVFKRGLDEAFVNALNEQYARGKDGWWRQFVDDKELFLAIRDNHVHVYYQGCRLIEVKRQKNGKLAANTHYKYLLRPEMEKEYVDVVVDGKPSVPDASPYFADRLSVTELKRSAGPYAVDEKSGVHDILQNNPHVLDVEVAIEGGQIDFAALQKGKAGQTHIVFYEAKLFGNKELRSESDKIRVVEQIDRYRGLLKLHRASIEDSYLLVSKNLCDLEGVGCRNPIRHGLLRGTCRFIIEEEPGLVVFGYDGDQKSGSVWRDHEERLRKSLNREPILLGNPARVKIPA